MVRNPRLGEIVRPYFLAPLPCPNLAFPVLRYLCMLFSLSDVQQPRTQYPERLLFVPVLRLLILTRHRHPRRHMRHPNRRIVAVDTLSPRPRCPKCLDPQLLGIQRNIHLISLGQNRHRHRRCMDPPTRLSLRHPLHSMHTTLTSGRGPGQKVRLHRPQLQLLSLKAHLWRRSGPWEEGAP